MKICDLIYYEGNVTPKVQENNLNKVAHNKGSTQEKHGHLTQLVLDVDHYLICVEVL